MSKLNVSALNLVPIRQGKSVKDAIDEMVDLAQHLESLDYSRYWIAEHHNTLGLASSATVTLIQHTLQHTSTLVVGSGGIMLPNHSPLVVAEQFGTLETLFKGRLNLGLGRAPGTDRITADALRRDDGMRNVNSFPQDVNQLLTFFGDQSKQGFVKANPGMDTHVPVYILGSSTDSARLAASLGLPYAFASHFAPQMLKEAIEIYRDQFEPSEYLDKPYVIAGMNAILAETNDEAKHLATTMQQFILNIIRSESNPLMPPTDEIDQIMTDYEKQVIESRFPTALLGDKDTALEQLKQFTNDYHIDEVMAVTYIYDTDKQHHSYTLLKEVVDAFNQQ